MGCYRCLVILAEREEPLDPVAVCRRCGLLTCARDGALDADYPLFICGVCETGRISESGGLPPQPPGPRRGGGGGGGTPRPDVPPQAPGGAGAYADSEEFERRKPGLADESRAHREHWRATIGTLLPELIDLGVDETARALAASRLEGDLGLAGSAETTLLLSSQLAAARDSERLKPELLADALGLGAWAIGAAPGDEPSAWQLAHLPDPRLRIALGYSALRTGTPQ